MYYKLGVTETKFTKIILSYFEGGGGNKNKKYEKKCWNELSYDMYKTIILSELYKIKNKK